jgi:hypothetical protein
MLYPWPGQKGKRKSGRPKMSSMEGVVPENKKIGKGTRRGRSRKSL